MTHYQILLHKEAQSSLQKLNKQRRERITDIITEVSKERKPTDHSKCEVLNNNYSETLYKIRVGDYRALAELDKPNLNILKIGERSKFYSDIDGIYAGM